MDTAELMERGARSLVVDLCQQLNDVIKAVPDLRTFAYSLARKSLGMKPMGRATGSKNGDGKKKLLAQLDKARKLRKSNTPKQRAQREGFKARWAEAKALGYTGGTLPSNRVMEQLRAKAGKAGAGRLTPNGKARPLHYNDGGARTRKVKATSAAANARWAEARALGYTGRTLPSKDVLYRLRHKATRKAPPTTPANGGAASTE